MPTPRQHGGAALQHIPLVAPGFKGLNKQAATSILGPEWATKLMESALDDVGRLSPRFGWEEVTSGTIAGTSSARITQLLEAELYDGTTEYIAGLDDAEIWRSTDAGINWTDISGGTTNSSTNIQFLNFNDTVYGVTDNGEDNIIYTGTTFADDGDAANEPNGSVGLAAFGRIWATDNDNQVVQYCALLDETDWASLDAGNIDMRMIWPDGDTVTALAVFNGSLVIFGHNNIAVYTDGAGSVLGVDPEQIYLADLITGVGCIARDSVVSVQGDLWFLSQHGVQSLGRLIQEKSNPLNNLSRNIQDYLQGLVAASTASAIRATYSPDDRFYLLSLPQAAGGAESGRTFAFDTRGKLDDGSVRVVGEWTEVPRAFIVLDNGTLLWARYDSIGKIGNYGGRLDAAADYTYEYESGWLDLTKQGLLIFPKRIEGLFFVSDAVTLTLKWAFDFSSNFHTRVKTITGFQGGGEWGVGEWGTDEWGGGSGLRAARTAGAGSGEYIKLGVSAIVTGLFSQQQIDLFAKIGRFK